MGICLLLGETVQGRRGGVITPSAAVGLYVVPKLEAAGIRFSASHRRMAR